MVHVAKDCRQLSSVVRQNITPVEMTLPYIACSCEETFMPIFYQKLSRDIGMELVISRIEIVILNYLEIR